MHLIGRPTALDRKLEPSDCHSQLRPLWSSPYNDDMLRYLEGKGIVQPATTAAAVEEHKDIVPSSYSAAPWLTPRSASQAKVDHSSSSSSSSSSVDATQPPSDGSWFLAHPRMWVEAVDAVSHSTIVCAA